MEKALLILAANAAAAFLVAVVKDVVNSLFRGRTRMVLQNLSTHRTPVRKDVPFVEISGRRAGLMGYLLTNLDLSPQVKLTVNATEVCKTTRSWHGRSVERIPLFEGIAVRAQSRGNLFWLLAAVLSVALAGGLMETDSEKWWMSAVACLLAAGGYVAAYYFSQTFEFAVQGASQTGVSFKPSVLEGRRVSFDQILEATEILMERVQAASALGPSAAGMPHMIRQPTYAGGPSQVPLPPFAPQPVPAENALSPKAYAGAGGAGQSPPERTKGTGTVEYGDDSTGLDSVDDWEGGPEPGTSDSLLVRQTLSRPETGLLRPPADLEDLDEYEDEEVEDSAPAANGGAHRGTVSWEEHADKTQDEMRAGEELAELKRSRPKRGEAKLRLRELMRRFPQTKTALKARKMLERLESGQ